MAQISDMKKRNLFFVFVPIFSGFVWLGMLLGMLLWWTVKENSEYLPPMREGQTIAFVPCSCPPYLFPLVLPPNNPLYSYISDIGAHTLQPLFIAAGAVTVVTFNAVFIAERWLRHRGTLHHNTSWFQKGLSICAIIAAVIGGIGLIILTCLNDLYHGTAHDVDLVIFM
jgi:hypothetical protein